jgi:UDP-N-acetylmuramate dehydrogenase
MTLPKISHNEKLEELAALDVGDRVFNARLRDYSSWQIGGPADLLVEPTTPQQVATVVRYARQNDMPMIVIGQGTNLLFADEGLRGIVLKIGNNMASLSIDGQRIVAEAGLWVPQLARQAMLAGLAGLEHIIGIPGTVGGLVLMNGGSHRRGIGENVVQVTAVDRDGELVQLSREACRFSYRHSALQANGAIVVGVELKCPTGDIRQIRREMVADLRERRRKFPRKLPNCGSVFLSTSEMHATVGPPGKIIEEAGLKGARVGQAEVSRQHANFIVNLGDATAADVLSLVANIRRTVKGKIGFDLKCEARYVTPTGKIIPADQA